MKRIKKFTKKTVVIILALIVIGTPLTYLTFLNSKEAEAAWFDESWGYREKVEISNSTSAQTDYQVMATLDTQTLATAGKIQTDCDDLRITDLGGNLLKFWVEPTSCNTTTTKIWTKLSTIPATGTTIYLYYGNPSASSYADSSPTTNIFIREISNVQGSWNMNEASANTCTGGVNDSCDTSGNGNNGAWNGNTANTTGKFSNGTSYDGNGDYTNISSNTALAVGTGDFTVSTWAKPGSDVTTAQIAVRFGNTSGSWSSQNANGLFVQDGLWYGHSRASDDTFKGVSTAASASTWAYVVVTRTSGTVRLYKDGAEVGTPATGANINITPNGQARIGAAPSDATSPFSGTIDEVRIYNKALSQAEITDLYGTGGDRVGYTSTNYANKELVRKYYANVSIASPGSEEKSVGPIAYWKLDDAQGQTAQDSTVSNNDGTLGADSGSSTDDPTWTTEERCVSGKCLSFDGGDYVTLSNSARNPFGSSFTYSFWINSHTIATRQIPVSNQHSGDYWNGIDISSSGNKEIQLTLQNNTSSSSFFWTTPNNTLSSNNTWYHITVTYSFTGTQANDAAIYVNGVRQTLTTSGSGTYGTFSPGYDSTKKFSIGRRESTTPGAFVQGRIDEFKIYNYARTATQVKTDYLAGQAKAGESAKLGGPSAGSGQLSQGLIGYWKMDETAANSCTGGVNDSCDSSGNGLNGAWNGNTATTTGKFGNGTSYDGSGDYIAVTDNALYETSGQKTISFWAKPANANANKTAISKYRNDTNEDGWLVLFNSSGNITTWIKNSAGTGTTSNPTYSYSANNWYHVVVTWDTNGGTVKLYVNGSYAGQSAAISGSFSGNTRDLLIGRDLTNLNGESNPFNGTIDDVRIYNRALSPKEISDLYNWSPGPVLHLKMDEAVSGDSKTLADTSGSGNNGTTYDGANNTGMNCNVSGKYGGGCSFDGTDDYIQVTRTVSLEPTSFSLEAWIKVADATPSESKVIIHKSGDSDTDYKGYYFSLKTDGTLILYVGTGAAWQSLNTTSTLQDNTWTHVAATFTSSRMAIYINGVESKNSSGSYTISYNTGENLYVASDLREAGNRYSLSGVIDDIRVYNYARSAKQVVEDMNAGHPAVGSPVGSAVGYWKFDEGYNLVAYNSGNSGSTLNGTITCGGGGCSNPTWNNSGKFGKAITLSAGNGIGGYISISNTSALSPEAGNFTISAWIQTSTTYPSGNNSNGWIYGDYGSDTNNLVTIYVDGSNSNKITGFYRDGNANAVTVSNQGSAVNDGAWHHVVWVRNSTTGYMYLDGKLIASNTNASLGTISTSTGQAPKIGQYTLGVDESFNGSIDEFKIYNYALTADEIKTEYNRGSSLVLGAAGTNSTYQINAANQEYCIPGDSTSCAAPIARWDFDEMTGTSAFDRSGNGNTGTFGGGTAAYQPLWVPGKSGGGVKFDGSDDYISLGTPSNFNITQPFSFEGWVKTSTDSCQALFGIGKSTDVAIHQDVFIGDGCVGALTNELISLTRKSDGHRLGYTTSTRTELFDGVWHHIAVTYSGSTTKIYLDGRSKTVTVGSGSNDGLWGNLSGIDRAYIGAYFTGSSSLNGSMDQIRIYNYVRSPAQITYDYNRGAPVGHWKMDECQGTSFKDSSGNANHGTVTIGASGENTVGTCTTSSTAWGDGATGKRNYSINLDGTDDYLSVADNTTVLRSIQTISLWFKPTSTINSSSNEFELYSKRLNSGNYDGVSGGFWGSADSNRGKIFMLNDPGAGGATTLYSQTNSWTGGVWHNVTWTADGTNMNVYIDGKKENSTSFTTSFTDAAATLYLGILYTAAHYRFPGSLDDVRIYNYPLTPLQVKMLYNNGAINFGPSTGAP